MTKRKKWESAFFPNWENMTVKEIREYLKEKTSVIIPIGVIEQHGYHLPLATDAIRATEMARLIGTETEILVAPTVTQSYSGGSCPGTINITPTTMSLVIRDMLISMRNQGFNKFYLFIAHGGSENMNALNNALKDLLRTFPSFEHTMIVLLPAAKLDIDNVSRMKARQDGDWHAGWHETSEMMYLMPSLVRMDELETDSEELVRVMTGDPDNYQISEKIVNDDLVIPRNRQRDDIKIGVMGFPNRASSELGKKIIESTVKGGCIKIKCLEEKYDRACKFHNKRNMNENY